MAPDPNDPAARTACSSGGEASIFDVNCAACGSLLALSKFPSMRANRSTSAQHLAGLGLADELFGIGLWQEAGSHRALDRLAYGGHMAFVAAVAFLE
jgi:hypothetical protein